MGNHFIKGLGLVLLSAVMTTAMADTATAPMPDAAIKTTTPVTLPDGSIETDATLPNGTTMKVIRHPDGSTEGTTTDANGNQDVVIRHADGTFEKKQIPKQP